MRDQAGNPALLWDVSTVENAGRGTVRGRKWLSKNRIEIILACAVLTVCVVRFWIVPLPSSLWVNEMVTIFVTGHGSGDPSLAVAPQVRKSAYYFLPKLSAAIFGPSEIAYRLPSVLAMAVALLFLALLASRLIHVRAGWFTVFACLALPGVNYQADDARPYAFGTCIAAAAAYFLVRWLDSSRWRDAALFLVCAALIWRIHLIFWPFYILLVLYALVRRASGDTEVGWGWMTAVFALLGISLTPVLWSALALLRDAKAHVIAPIPSLKELRRSLQFPLPLFCAATLFVLSRRGKWRRPMRRISPASLTLILGWWLVQPLALFGFSHLTGESVFVTRYLYLGLPGAALTAVAVSAWFIPAARWNQVSVLLGIVVFLAVGQWRTAWPPHHNSGWRGASAKIEELKLTPQTPIICPSPFIEARSPVWRPNYPLPGFLYAHLPVYPFTGKPYLFPFAPSPDSETYATQLSQTVLKDTDRFVIYGGDHNVLFWRDWFAAQPDLAGWSSRRLGPFGDVDAVVFEKNSLITTSR